jgi:hypothetical protein
MDKKIEFFIEDFRVDLFPNESFALSFSISEISEIGRRTSAFSREITIPSTNNNNITFTSLFDTTIDAGFNPISRKRAVLYVDGIAVIKGYFKLLGVQIRDNKYVSYKGILYEEQINFIQAIEPFNLDNLIIPVTGYTDVIKAPFTYLTDFNFTSVVADYITEINNTPTNIGLVYSGLTFNNQTTGNEVIMPRTLQLAPGVIYSKKNVVAYEATSDQVVELDILLNVFNNLQFGGKYKYAIIKSDYKTPITGTFTDYEILNNEIDAIPAINQPLQFNCVIPLFSGDKFRFEIYETSGNPITLLTSSFQGKVYDATVEELTGYTITPQTIVKSNLINSSDDGVIVYPLIDYGQKYTFLNFNVSRFLNIKNTLGVNTNALRPSVFAKHIWDAIFKQAGFTYKSNFINSEDFKKLIIVGGLGEDDLSTLVYKSVVNPNKSNLVVQLSNTNDIQTLNTNNQVNNYEYNHFHLSNTPLGVAINNNKFFVNDVIYDQYHTHAVSTKFRNVRAHTVDYNINGTFRYYYGYSLPTTEDYGVFATAAEDGKYRINTKISFTSFPATNKDDNNIIYDYPTTYFLQIQKLRIGSYKYYPTSSTAPEYSKWEIIKEKRVTRVKNTSNQNLSLSLDETTTLTKGDMIRVILIADDNRTGFPSNSNLDLIVNNIQINNSKTETFFEVYRKGTMLGRTFDNAAILLPKNFKQSNFILEIAKMFNLYFQVDKENSFQINIQPRDVYYSQGNIVNWENKIDFSKQINIDILSHDYPKKQIFKYRDDNNDYLSTKFSEMAYNNLILGSFVFESPNDYNRDTDTMQLSFAPSYLQQVSDPRIKITKIHKPTLYDNSETNQQPEFRILPRIMFYKPMPLNFDDYKITLSSNFIDRNYVPYSIGGFVGLNQNRNYNLDFYPYAGHLNDPINPTFDLNFITDFKYLPGTAETKNNLFNTFYKNEMIELTDQTARKITCFVDLKPYDIVNLNFYDIYYFKKDYWRLIEISNFETSSDINETTRCIFIKVVLNNTNDLIDYSAFKFGGINGGTARGLLGLPLGVTSDFALAGGTVLQPVDWSSLSELQEQRNKLNYDISFDNQQLTVAGDDIVTPLINITTQETRTLIDGTLSIEEKLGYGNIIIFDESTYPIDDESIIVTLNDEQKRMLVKTTSTKYLSYPTNLVLPSLGNLYDGYTFTLKADTNTTSAFTINYINAQGDEIQLYDINAPLILSDKINCSLVTFQYWAGNDNYIVTIQ